MFCVFERFGHDFNSTETRKRPCITIITVASKSTSTFAASTTTNAFNATITATTTSLTITCPHARLLLPQGSEVLGFVQVQS